MVFFTKLSLTSLLKLSFFMTCFAYYILIFDCFRTIGKQIRFQEIVISANISRKIETTFWLTKTTQCIPKQGIDVMLSKVDVMFLF